MIWLRSPARSQGKRTLTEKPIIAMITSNLGAVREGDSSSKE